MTIDELRRKKDSGPYDASLENNFSLYDNLPYYRDISICNQSNICLISGNVIKYYRCNVIGDFQIVPDK
jgi:hypothetical protein